MSAGWPISRGLKKKIGWKLLKKSGLALISQLLYDDRGWLVC